MTNLNDFEIASIGGGTDSIIQTLEERFPFGVWHNGSFYPNGTPDMTTPGCGTEPW